MKITEIVLDRLRLVLDPPLPAAWDPVPRPTFDATVVRVHTDEGVTGVGLRAENPGMRLAAGEMQQSAPELLRWLEHDVLDVHQPDVVLSVGMSRARTLAEVAALKNRHFTPHTWTDGIGMLANLHVVAGVGGGPFVEYPYNPPDRTPARRDFMLAEPIRVDPSGHLTVPDAPGLGVRLDEDAIRRWRR